MKKKKNMKMDGKIYIYWKLIGNIIFHIIVMKIYREIDRIYH